MDIVKIEKHISQLILGNIPPLLNEAEFSDEFDFLVLKINELTKALSELNTFTCSIASGNLSMDPPARRAYLISPLKDLHSNLLHMCWNIKQIARGDFGQRVDYMGELSDYFNDMILSLCEREKSYQAQINRLEDEKNDIKHSHNLLNSILENIPEVVFVLRKRNILFRNNAAAEILDALPDDIPGDNVVKFIKKYRSSAEKESSEYYDSFLKKWYTVDITRILWKDGQTANIFLLSNITVHKKNEQRLKKAAETDALTQVGNREMGMRTLTEALGRRNLFPITICFMDLDGLKHVNDTHGHSAGDEYLKHFTAQLKRTFNSGEFISRVGGDEFLIIMCNADHALAESRVLKVEKSLLRSKRRNGVYTYEFSYGILEIPSDSDYTPQELIQKADILMYKQKRNKKLQKR